MTGITSRCVRENRASGEHGGPGLKLDTVVGADSFFFFFSHRVICRLPPTAQFDLLFIYFFAETAHWFGHVLPVIHPPIAAAWISATRGVKLLFTNSFSASFSLFLDGRVTISTFELGFL